MGSKQRSVQAGLSRDSPSLSWEQSEAIRESQQGSNITTLCHKSITQLPPWRWDWRKAKRNLGDQLGGCEGNSSEQGECGGWKGREGIFKVNLELWRSLYILFHNSNVHMWEKNVFWKGQSTKSRDYFARIPARLISTYPTLTHTLQNTPSCFWKPWRFSVELTLEPKLSLSFLQGFFFSYQQVFRVSKKAWQWSRNKKFTVMNTGNPWCPHFNPTAN